MGENKSCEITPNMKAMNFFLKSPQVVTIIVVHSEERSMFPEHYAAIIPVLVGFFSSFQQYVVFFSFYPFKSGCWLASHCVFLSLCFLLVFQWSRL